MQAHFIDLTDPAFSTRSQAVQAARDAAWYARTPYGLAVLRHREAGLLLRDRRLRQGSHAWPRHTGLTGPFAEFWTRSIIAREGPDHRRLRSVAQGALRPEAIEALRPEFSAIAHGLLDRIEAGMPERVEFMTAFAVPFAGQAICALLGLPLSDWPRVADDAATLGLAMGVDAGRHEAEVNAACVRLFGLADELIVRAGTQPEGFVPRLMAGAADAPGDELRDLIVISIFGGVDTTRSQLGLGMALFIDHPDQWQRLRADPARVPAAIEEMIRARPTTTWATREAVETFDFGGLTVKAGETVQILVHATARDPAVCADPAFDIGAERKMHFGFGGGAHHCLGALVARTDMAAALDAMVARIARFDHAGAPEFLPDSGNTSPVHLPLAIEFV